MYDAVRPEANVGRSGPILASFRERESARGWAGRRFRVAQQDARGILTSQNPGGTAPRSVNTLPGPPSERASRRAFGMPHDCAWLAGRAGAPTVHAPRCPNAIGPPKRHAHLTSTSIRCDFVDRSARRTKSASRCHFPIVIARTVFGITVPLTVFTAFTVVTRSQPIRFPL